MPTLPELLSLTVELHGSDLHLSIGHIISQSLKSRIMAIAGAEVGK